MKHGYKGLKYTQKRGRHSATIQGKPWSYKGKHFVTKADAVEYIKEQK